MRFKSILLTGVLVLVLAGVIAATTGARWWEIPAVSAALAKDELPPAPVEYGRLIEQFRSRDSATEISGMVRIYDEEKGGILKEAKPFRYYREGMQYYSALSYLQTYNDGKIVLVVDTLHRSMQVFRPVEQKPLDPFLGNLSPAMLFSDTARFRLSGTVDQHGAERILALHSDFSPEVRVCRVYYDTVSYRPYRMEIEWWKDRSGLDTTSSRVWLAKMEYVYRKRGDLHVGEAIRTYVTVGQEGIKPTSHYADYHVTANF